MCARCGRLWIAMTTADTSRAAQLEPAASIGSRLTRIWQRFWFPAALAVVYLYGFPYFEGIRSANELSRIYLSIAIVERHALDIGPELQRYQPTPDTSTYQGKLYCNKAPGMSLLAVPVYAAQKLLGGGTRPTLPEMFLWFRVWTSAIPSLLFLLLLSRALEQLVERCAVRRLVLAAYALGTMALVYGTLFIAHQLSAVLIGTAFCLIFLHGRGRGGRLSLLWAGLAAGASVLVDYQTAFIGPPLFAYLLYRARPRLRSALSFCVAAGVPLLALLFYHWACFDSPFRTGYHFPTNPVFAQWHSQGFLGLKEFELGRFGARHFSPDDGLFYYSPFLLLALPGLVLMLRRRGLRAEGLLCATVIAWFVYFISAVTFISGWDVGPRYVTCALPFYMVPVAVLADRASRRPWALALVAGPMVAAIAIYTAVNAVFPHYPGHFSDPLFDVTLRFGLAGYLPYNLGWLAGLRGLVSVVPYAVVVAALVLGLLFRLQRGLGRRLAVAGGALVLAAAILGGYDRLLAWRARPVPADVVQWMERIWEPRYPGMKRQALLRKIGPERTRR